MKHYSSNNKQAINEAKSLRVVLHLSYTWSLIWVDFYVSIMFRKIFSKPMVHNIVNSINCKWCFYTYNWQQVMPYSKTWWLKNTFNIQCMKYQPFIKIKHHKKQAPYDVKSLRKTLHLWYIWTLSWVNFYVSIMFHSFLILVLVLVCMIISWRNVFFKSMVHNIVNSINCKRNLCNVGNKQRLVPKRHGWKTLLIFSVWIINYS